MRSIRSVVLAAAAVFFMTALAGKVEAKTFVFAHALEVSGRITNTQNTFDTTFFITYTGGLTGGSAPGATVDFYIYDDLTGLPLRSATNVVICNPCTFSPNAANRKGIGNIEGIANSVGGLPRPNVTGSMVFVVSGDSANVDISAFVFNSHTSANDLSVFSLNVQPIDDSLAPAATRTEVMNHWREDSLMNDQPGSFSQYLYVLYAGGLPGTRGNGGANVNLRLYDDTTGLLLRSATNQVVCDPCTLALSTSQRKQAFTFDQLIRDAGGFPRPDVTGFATVETTGDTEDVLLQLLEVNNSGPNEAQWYDPYRGAPRSATSNNPYFPGIVEKQAKVTNTPNTFDTQIEMTYSGGLTGFPTGSGATADLFIYDQATGQPMMNNGQAVCLPCSFQFSPTTPKISVTVDDLITARGGSFDSPVKLGFGVLMVGGADPGGVSADGFVVNSHTGPLDLSAFGYEPEALRPPELNSRVLSSEYTYSHFRERAGKTSNTTFTFDTEFHAAYHGSQSATLELYLYDEDTSLPLRSLTNNVVCNPCTFPLNGPNSKQQINVDDLLAAAGGIPRSDLGGFAKIKVTGDAGNVAVLGTLVNSHSGPNDLSTSVLPHRLSVRRTTDFDFDGDGRADIGVFRPSEGNWYLTNSSDNGLKALHWGLATDRIAPGDYDGDGKTDFAVWRPNGVGDPDRSFYYMLQSSTNTIRIEQFGRVGDIPRVGDWDGDGKDDLTVYRAGASPADQSFFFHRPSASPGTDFLAFGWGLGGDIPVVGDWDGDGRVDPTVFRPSNSVWYIQQSASGSLRAERWGLSTDIPVPGDFDGDGKLDITVWRPSSGTWYISQSSNGGIRYVNWGVSTDKPVPADYDGDGRSDVAVWRESDRVWYLLNSSNGEVKYQKFGLNGDRPFQCVTDTAAFATCP